jgi:isoleucyl-tRNA synthetase
MGVFYEKSNQIIIDRLKAQNSLLVSAKINHSAAVD